MIISFASDTGRDLFDGNWSLLAKRKPIEPLEECFMDLRIIDAAAEEADILKAFKGRYTKNGAKGFSLSEPKDCSVRYEVAFRWAGTNAEQVHVTIFPSGETKRAR